MFIRLFIICLNIVLSQILASCPYIRQSVILSECIFDTNLYISLGANIFNSNSIHFIGYYSFNQNYYTNNTLIYNLNNRWMLLVPLLIKCNNQPKNLIFTECQYTMRQTKFSDRLLSTAEYMTTQLSVVNITDLGMQSVLFLQPGEISLRSCKAYDCSKEIVYLTASNETFNFKINYEKPIDSKCQYNEDCQLSYSIKDLIHCDKLTQTCQCYDENISNIDITGIGRICTDSIDQSNCTKFSKRCLKWCDGSETSYCLCPKLTRKVRKINGLFDCELEPNGICRFNDEHLIGSNIRKCPTGTYCDGDRCRPLTVNREILQSSTTTTIISNLLSITTTTIYKQINNRQNETTGFIRTLIAIAIAITLFFILILLIITIVIKSHRFDVPSTSFEDKVSSSSFAQSTSTATSTDSPININYPHQIKQQQQQRTMLSIDYENYLKNSPFVQGLVPQTNLTPKFHRQQQTIDEKRRIPLEIRSPSLSRINPFIDHALLTTTEQQLKKKHVQVPKITRLYNGDVLISA